MINYPLTRSVRSFIPITNGLRITRDDDDTVITIKNLPVKGTWQSIKAVTAVKNIRSGAGDHYIDCRIDSVGAITETGQPFSGQPVSGSLSALIPYFVVVRFECRVIVRRFFVVALAFIGLTG
ncbi:hypothetical protein FO440_09990 [Mucilaginibacter corticis]|uniref:Protein YjdM C-terminal domain-containing protein n=1 Tax=Mucilaginibacter corticis TaxID=2597670 RepID=A0A556MX22_9SPHI|nr:PhnA domain-containing protein [Mucilaginibacter corticis]TSJ44484.1 hypothetical protein FO440_09990 [Mucilaginibacter corticis]